MKGRTNQRSGGIDKVRRRTASLAVDFADFTDLAAVEAAIRPDTSLLWIETPTNPLLKIVNLEAIAVLARMKGLVTVVDPPSPAPSSGGLWSSASSSTPRPNISTVIPT